MDNLRRGGNLAELHGCSCVSKADGIRGRLGMDKKVDDAVSTGKLTRLPNCDYLSPVSPRESVEGVAKPLFLASLLLDPAGEFGDVLVDLRLLRNELRDALIGVDHGGMVTASKRLPDLW